MGINTVASVLFFLTLVSASVVALNRPASLTFFEQAWGFSSKKMETLREPLHPSFDTVWVFRSDGAQSCFPQSGMSLSKGAFELKAANIPIFESRKGNDGKVHAQVCGAGQGSTNLFRIPRENLEGAVALGYQELSHQEFSNQGVRSSTHSSQ